MPHTVDTGEANLSLDDGQSLSGQDDYIELDTSTATDIRVYVDNSTTGTKAATYDLSVETFKHGNVDDWMHEHSTTGTQNLEHQFDAPSNKVRIDVTNSSSTNNKTYRIWAESQKLRK